MSYGRDWSVTVAITASRWSPDTQAAHTAWHETYDGMRRGHHMFDCGCDLVTHRYLRHETYYAMLNPQSTYMVSYDMTRRLHHQTYLYRMLKIVFHII